MEYNTQEKHILDAALNIIAKHSISGTRMHLIAEEAGMVPSNLHYHFKTKQALLIALLSDLQETFTTKRNFFTAKSAPTLESRLTSFFEQKKQLILQEPKYDRAQFDFWVLGQSDGAVNILFRNSYDQWRNHITQSILEFCPHIDARHADLLAYTMISMMMGGSMQYLNGDGFDLDAYFALCLNLILSSIKQQETQTPALP